MGGDYYGDIISGQDQRMDYDPEDQYKQDDLKMLTFKVKSAPQKGLSMTNGTDMVRGKEPGAWDFKHKSEVKYGCASNQYQTKVVASNKDFTLNVEATPKQLNNGEVSTTVEVEGKIVPAKNEWEGKVHAKVGNFKMGPVTSFSNFEFNTNQASNHGLVWAQNLVFQNYHCAFKTDVNLVNKSFNNCYGVLAAMNTEYGNWYFRSNCLQRFVGVGWWKKCCGGELQYDFYNKNKGLFDQPVFLRFGAAWTLSDASKLSMRFNGA